jgi:hypothetical protein
MRRGVDGRAIGDGFAALHESGNGPERRFAALPQYVCYQGETGLFADIAKVALMSRRRHCECER